MKTVTFLLAIASASISAAAQQPNASPSPITSGARPCCTHRIVRRIKSPVAPIPATKPPRASADFFMGEARVDVTKDETVVRLAMAQHGSVLIELPANDGPRYIIPGDPEMATVDEKALERNKRAIIVRPGSLFVSPPPNRKAQTPAATVTAQMRSGLVVTFLFYPVEDLAQNVHRCVLSYNRDEVVARRRAAGLPVNLDNVTTEERRIQTGQSTAPTSISVEPTEDSKNDGTATSKSPPSSGSTSEPPKPKNDARTNSSSDPSAIATPSPVVTERVDASEQITALTKDALAHAIKKPKQFKGWTKPSHGLALSVLKQVDTKAEFQVLVIAVKNTSAESLKLTSAIPDLNVEMLDDKGATINLQSIKKLHAEISSNSGSIPAGATTYYAIAYVAPVLGVHQRVKVIVGQTNAADEPASIALANSGR